MPAASGSEADDDVNNNPAAYNLSIYVMVGVPYLTFGLLSFLIYRGCKGNAQYWETQDKTGQTTS